MGAHEELISLTGEKISTQWTSAPLEVQDFYPVVSAKFLEKWTLTCF